MFYLYKCGLTSETTQSCFIFAEGVKILADDDEGSLPRDLEKVRDGAMRWNIALRRRKEHLHTNLGRTDDHTEA